MRIPPSVFVMSVLLAVPFGIAIKQTVKHEDPAGRLALEEQELAANSSREQAEYEKQQAEQKVKEAAEKKAHDEQLMGLFGAHPATMGPELKGVELGGMPEPGLIDQLQMSPLGIEVEREPSGQIYAVSARLGVDFYRDDGSTGCTVARERLETTWGPGKGGIWLDPATHVRLSIKDSRCEIRFDRYVEVADWMKQLPLDYVGKKLSDVKELGGASGETTWYLPGVAAGDMATSVSVATSEKDRVIGLTVTTSVPWDDRDAILAALTKKFGKPAIDVDVPDMYSWKRPHVTMTFEGTRIEIVVGKLAEEP